MVHRNSCRLRLESVHCEVAGRYRVILYIPHCTLSFHLSKSSQQASLWQCSEAAEALLAGRASRDDSQHIEPHSLRQWPAQTRKQLLSRLQRALTDALCVDPSCEMHLDHIGVLQSA